MRSNEPPCQQIIKFFGYTKNIEMNVLNLIDIQLKLIFFAKQKIVMNSERLIR